MPGRALLILVAMALTATVEANSGSIGIRSVIQTPTCTVAGTNNASGEGHGIVHNFGDVPLSILRPASGWRYGASAQHLWLDVTCPGPLTGYTRARLHVDAASGSGVDEHDRRLLRLSSESTAQGIGVGLWIPGQAGAALDLSTNPTFFRNFVTSGTNRVAQIQISTQLSLTRNLASAVGGTVKAVLPFTLSYE